MTNEARLQLGVDHGGPDGDLTCVTTWRGRELVGVSWSLRKSGKTITKMARIMRMFAAAKRLSDRNLLFTVRKVPRRDA